MVNYGDGTQERGTIYTGSMQLVSTTGDGVPTPVANDQGFVVSNSVNPGLASDGNLG